MSKKKKAINVDKLRGSWEPQVLKGLKALQRKYKYGIEYESRHLHYTIRHVYTPDFVVSLPDGRTIYIEAKGYFRSEDRAKLKHVRDQNPNADIRLLFQKDSKVHKSSKMRYSDWCNKHNFEYAVGKLPESWFEDNPALMRAAIDYLEQNS